MRRFLFLYQLYAPCLISSEVIQTCDHSIVSVEESSRNKQTILQRYQYYCTKIAYREGICKLCRNIRQKNILYMIRFESRRRNNLEMMLDTKLMLED